MPHPHRDRAQMLQISGSFVHQFPPLARGTKARFLAWSPDGSQLAAAGDANYFSIFDIQGKRKLFDYEPPDRCLGIAWVPTSVGLWLGNQLSNGHALLLNTGFLDRSPLNIETHSLESLRDRHTNLKGSIAAAQDAGTSLLATALGTEVKVWEVLAEGELNSKLTYSNASQDSSYISHLAFLPNGTHLLAFFMNERLVVKLDISGISPPEVIDTCMPIVTAAVSAPQNRFVVHNATDRGDVYDLDTMEKLPKCSIPYVGHRIPVPISFADNGRIILTAESGLVKAFALNGVPLGVLELGCKRVLSISATSSKKFRIAVTVVYEDMEAHQIWDLWYNAYVS